MRLRWRLLLLALVVGVLFALELAIEPAERDRAQRIIDDGGALPLGR